MFNGNGAPKTGTHLLLQVLRKYKGVAASQVPDKHTPFKAGLKLENHVHITRNPRNVMISWHRFTSKKNKPIAVNIPRVEKIKNGATIIDKMPDLIKETGSYIGWLRHNKTMNVRFEELLSDPDIINQIGEYLGLEPSENQFYKSYGGTSTFTGKYGPDFSLWQDYKINDKLIWTDEVHEAWVHYGGLSLEAALNCDVHKRYVRRPYG